MRTKENTNLRKNLQIYVDEIKDLYLSGTKAKEVAEKYGDGCLSYTYTSGKFKDVHLDITTGSSAMKLGLSNFLNEIKVNYSIIETKKKGKYLL